jgi:putative heme degradation protein
MKVRDRVAVLLDVVPEEDFLTVERMLRGLVASEQDPFATALAAAAEDDEVETDEEREAVARAWEAVQHGDTMPHEEVMRRARGSR